MTKNYILGQKKIKKSSVYTNCQIKFNFFGFDK